MTQWSIPYHTVIRPTMGAHRFIQACKMAKEIKCTLAQRRDLVKYFMS